MCVCVCLCMFAVVVRLGLNQKQQQEQTANSARQLFVISGLLLPVNSAVYSRCLFSFRFLFYLISFSAIHVTILHTSQTLLLLPTEAGLRNMYVCMCVFDNMC